MSNKNNHSYPEFSPLFSIGSLISTQLNSAALINCSEFFVRCQRIENRPDIMMDVSLLTTGNSRIRLSQRLLDSLGRTKDSNVSKFSYSPISLFFFHPLPFGILLAFWRKGQSLWVMWCVAFLLSNNMKAAVELRW